MIRVIAELEQKKEERKDRVFFLSNFIFIFCVFG